MEFLYYDNHNDANTHFVCGGDYSPFYEYDYETGYSYPLQNVESRESLSEQMMHVNFWDCFEKSKARIANYLNPKWLDYLEEKSDTQLQQKTLYVLRRHSIKQGIKTSGGSLTENSYVTGIHYGAIIKVVCHIIPDKQGIQHDIGYNSGLSRSCTGKCTLFINGEKIQELDANSLISFFKNGVDWNSNKSCFMVEVTNFGDKKSKLKIENKEILSKFLQNLYLSYKKIEKKLEKIGPEHTNVNLQDTEELTYDELFDRLHKSVDEFNNTDQYNIKVLYPVMKRLFKSYQAYIKHCLANRKDITVGEITLGCFDKVKTINEGLITVDYPIEIEKSWNNSHTSLIPVSSHATKVEKFKASIFEKIKVLDYVIMLGKYVEMVESKLTSSGLKEIPKYKYNPTKNSGILEVIAQSTVELKNVKDQNVINIYPVTKVLYETFCIHINSCSNDKKDVDLIKYIEEETVEKLIKPVKNWTVICCGNFILSESYGWYTFQGKFEPLNSSLNEENKRRFVEFLINLYKCYTKMEIKLNHAGYDKIYEHKTCENATNRTICKELDKAIEEFRSGFESNPLDAYSSIKKLYCCYIEYLNYCVQKKIETDEGETLPGTSEKLKEWMKKLDSWNLKKVGNKWQESFKLEKKKEDKKEVRSGNKEMIMNQLKKHHNQHDDVKNKKINVIIEVMNNFGEKSAVVSVLIEEIKKLNLDGDTNELVDKYNQM